MIANAIEILATARNLRISGAKGSLLEYSQTLLELAYL
jgi:hypothetical protein